MEGWIRVDTDLKFVFFLMRPLQFNFLNDLVAEALKNFCVFFALLDRRDFSPFFLRVRNNFIINSATIHEFPHGFEAHGVEVLDIYCHAFSELFDDICILGSS